MKALVIPGLACWVAFATGLQSAAVAAEWRVDSNLIGVFPRLSLAGIGPRGGVGPMQEKGIEVPNADLGDDARFQDHIGFTRLRQAGGRLPNGALSSVIDVDFLGMPALQDPEFSGKEIALSDTPSIRAEAPQW